MIIGGNNNLAENFRILNKMGAKEKLEAIQVNVSLDKNHFHLIAGYTPRGTTLTLKLHETL